MASNQKKRMLAIAIAGATAAGSTVTFAPTAKAYTQQQVQQQVTGSGNDLPFNTGWVVRENTQYITFDQANPFYYLDLNDCYEWRIVRGKDIVSVSPNLQQDERGNVWATGIKLTPAQENLDGIVELHLRDQHGNITIYYLCITNNMITGDYPSNPVVRTVTETAAPVTVTNTETVTQDPEVVEVTKTVAGQPVTETKTVTPEVHTETIVSTVKGEPVTTTVEKTVTPEPKVVEVTKTVEGKPVVETKTETIVAEPVTKTVTPEPKVVEVTKTVEGKPVVETKTETPKPEVVTETVTRTETKTAAPVTVAVTETQDPKVVEVTKTVEGKPVTETKTVTPEVITETVTHYPKPEEPVVETVTKTVTPDVETPAPVTETVTTTLPVEKDSNGTEIVIVNNNVNNNIINNGGNTTPGQTNINSNTSEVVVTEDDSDGSIKVIEARLSKNEGDHIRVEDSGSIKDSDVVISDDSKLVLKRNEAGEIIFVATDKAQVGDMIVVKIGEKTIINVTITDETVPNETNTQVSVVEKTIKNTQDVVLEGKGSYKVVKGEDKVHVYKNETGEFRFIPKEGATGEFVVEETVDGKIVRYVFTITDQKITREVTTTNTGSVSVTVTPESNEVRVAEGSENLVEVKKDENGKWIVLPKGPVGTAVVEIVHPKTGRVVGRYDIHIQPSIKNYKILSIQKLKINPIVDGNKLVVVAGGNLGKLEGNTFVPNEDAQGRATVHEVDADGNVVGKYIIDITRGAFTHELREKDQFLIAWDENTRVDVTKGKDIVDVKVETIDGRKVWVVTPKPGKEGTAVVDLIKTINGEDRVVSRYYLNVKKGERNVRVEDEYSSNGETIVVTPGKKGSTVKVLEGGSLVEVKENPDGSVEIVPKDPKKTGGVIVVSVDEDGNVDKQINIGLNGDDPETAEGAPNLSMPENGKDGRSITIKLPKDKGELKLVGKDGNPVDSKSGLKLIKKEDGTYELQWSGNVDTTPEFKLQWIVDGKVLREESGRAITGKDGHNHITFIKNSGNNNTTVDNGSSNGSSVKDLDGKCIAGIVGLAAPLLLAIPVAVLSQVQIPGLEGLSAQIKGAIQDANTRIQQGLGIFNEDRAARAAGFQGAFNIQNPEMLGMAGGALAAITLGLLAVDGLMRACGAEEYTSSYQVGKATGNEKLMGLSSTKVEKDASAKDNGSSEK